MSCTITCDRRDHLIRLAVWEGGKLADLYVDRLDRPDPTGAFLCGRVDRVVAGQEAAWIDVGLQTQVFVAKAKDLKAGQKILVEIKTPSRHGKAPEGLCRAGDPGEVLGWVKPPPAVWQRAVVELKGKPVSSIVFSDMEDRRACVAWLEKTDPQNLKALKPLCKEPVHPDLDDILEGLLQPRVPLNASASLVVEETEALVAIDINAEKGGSPLGINLAAVPEIARQIRLRNLGGILIVDALKMPRREDASKLLNAFRRAVLSDPVGVDVFDMTRLGLVEMTRRRKGFSLKELMGV